MPENIARAQEDKDQQDTNFEHDNARVQICRLFNSDDQDCSNRRDPEECDQVEYSGRVRKRCGINMVCSQRAGNAPHGFPASVIHHELSAGRSRQCRRNVDAEILQQAEHVSAPA